jgi:hypothetical protein
MATLEEALTEIQTYAEQSIQDAIYNTVEGLQHKKYLHSLIV